jgi:hypothetical protein
LRGDFDLEVTAGEVETMIAAFREAGAAVLTMTFPDPRRVNRIARIAQPRMVALNARIRDAAERHGALVVDLERIPVASDPRLWSIDRLHANPEGHRRIAAAAAHLLGLPDAGDSWSAALPPAVRRSLAEAVAYEVNWVVRYFAPWVIRRARGRSSGDGIVAKRPDLEPFETVR